MSQAAQDPISISSLLRAVEQERGLYKISAGGWRLWPLFRADTGLWLSHPVYREQARRSLRQKLTRIGAMFADLPSLLAPPAREVLVKTYNGQRVAGGAASPRDFMCDDLIIALGRERCLKVEGINNGNLPVFGAAHVACDFRGVILPPLARVARLPQSLRADITAGCMELVPVVRDVFGRTDFTLEGAVSAAEKWFRNKAVVGAWLRRTNPRAVITCCFSETVLIAAAREAGIPTAEMQHGLFGETHPARLWGDAADVKAEIPLADRFWVFGDYWRRSLEEDPFYRGRVDVVGRPETDRWREYRAAISPGRRRKRLLITAQGLYQDELTKVLSDAFALFGADVPELVIKLHPVYDKSPKVYLDGLKDIPGVKVLGAGDAEQTMELIAGADVHASISSTCHYDALGLGIPTIVIALPSSEAVVHLHREGMAGFARNGSEFAAALRTCLAHSPGEAAAVRLCAPGSVKKLSELTEKMIAMRSEEWMAAA